MGDNSGLISKPLNIVFERKGFQTSCGEHVSGSHDQQLLKAWAALGHNVTWFAGSVTFGGKQGRVKRVDNKSIGDGTYTVIPVDDPRNMYSPNKDVLAAADFCKFEGSGLPKKFIPNRRTVDCPTIYHRDAYFGHDPFDRKTSVEHIWMKWLELTPDGHVAYAVRAEQQADYTECYTQQLADFLRDREGIRPEKLIVAPQFCDPTVWYHDPAPKKNEDTFRLVYVTQSGGFETNMKGVDTYINACGILLHANPPLDIECTLVTRVWSAQQKQFIKLVKERWPRIRIVQNATLPVIRRELSNADLQVSPTLWGGFPNEFVESMFCECPNLITALPSNLDSWDGHFFSIPVEAIDLPKEKMAFAAGNVADIVRQLMRDRTVLRAAARDWRVSAVKRIGLPGVAQRILDIYKEKGVF